MFARRCGVEHGNVVRGLFPLRIHGTGHMYLHLADILCINEVNVCKLYHPCMDPCDLVFFPTRMVKTTNLGLHGIQKLLQL